MLTFLEDVDFVVLIEFEIEIFSVFGLFILFQEIGAIIAEKESRGNVGLGLGFLSFLCRANFPNQLLF